MASDTLKLPFMLGSLQHSGQIAFLRYQRDGLQQTASSDWDLAVLDPGAAAAEFENENGRPDLVIRRQYVEQRFYDWGQVDFLPSFERNGVVYLSQERFWAGVTSDFDDGLPRPRLAHDAFLAWLTGVLMGGRYNAKYTDFIKHAATTDGEELFDCLQEAFGKGWARRLIQLANAGEAGRAVAHTKELRRALYLRRAARAPFYTTWKQLTHWKTELKHHYRPPFPWVAILGPDGSGKSSVIAGVTEELERRRLKVHMLHWRPKILWKAAEVPGGITTDPHAKEPRGALVSLVKLFALGAEWWGAHFWQLRHPRAKDRYVLSDRYYDDLLVDQRRYRFGAPVSWAKKAFSRFPKPSKVIVLVGDPEIIHARKEEVTLEELRRQIDAYREFGKSLGDRAEIIDATQPLADVVKQAKAVLIEEARKNCGIHNLPEAEPTAIRPEELRAKARLTPVIESRNIISAENSSPTVKRLLLSAYSCSPRRGAEAHIAWKIAKEFCNKTELTILTRAINREAIEESGEDWIEKVQWIYFDPPRWLSFWRTEKRGIQPFYVLWQLLARRRMQPVIREKNFDLIHHITFGTYLMPSPLADLGVPLVFGPVGGGDETPEGLSDGYSAAGKRVERFRAFLRRTLDKIPFFPRWYHATAWTLAATAGTARRLADLGVTRQSLMPQSAIDSTVPDSTASRAGENREPGKLRLITASRLVHWKAVDLALDAIAVLRDRGCDVSLTVLQEGPEAKNLQKKVAALGLDDFVRFTGRLPAVADVFKEMEKADALVHPALHEAFGQACLEALSLGLPVVCMNWGGPALIVDDTCGYRVDPGTREQTVERLAAALIHLAGRLDAGEDLPAAARRRSEDFSWQSMGDELWNLYEKVIENNHSARTLPSPQLVESKA